eukprot:gene20306-24357_t
MKTQGCFIVVEGFKIKIKILANQVSEALNEKCVVCSNMVALLLSWPGNNMCSIVACRQAFEFVAPDAVYPQELAQNGLPPVQMASCVMNAAQFHSNYQASISTMTHNDPHGGLIARAQYYGATSVTAAAENVAYNQQSDQAVMNAWIASSGHLANILNNKVNLVGFGMQLSSAGKPYWTQLFIKGSCASRSAASDQSDFESLEYGLIDEPAFESAL